MTRRSVLLVLVAVTAFAGAGVGAVVGASGAIVGSAVGAGCAAAGLANLGIERRRLDRDLAGADPLLNPAPWDVIGAWRTDGVEHTIVVEAAARAFFILAAELVLAMVTAPWWTRTEAGRYAVIPTIWAVAWLAFARCMAHTARRLR
jgi:hypothetical protein